MRVSNTPQELFLKKKKGWEKLRERGGKGVRTGEVKLTWFIV